MYGALLTVVSLTHGVYSTHIPPDVQVSPSRQVLFPIDVDPARKDKIARIRFLVSEDFGKRWKYTRDIEPGDSPVQFVAERDGQFWFALQIEYKDGRCEPATLDKLAAVRKCFLCSNWPASEAYWKSNSTLARENEELKKLVEQLRKRIKELEAARPAK